VTQLPRLPIPFDSGKVRGWPAGLEVQAEAVLPDFLLLQRWYPAKGAGRPEVKLSELVPLRGVQGLIDESGGATFGERHA
jgi:hypothetical protein